MVKLYIMGFYDGKGLHNDLSDGLGLLNGLLRWSRVTYRAPMMAMCYITGFYDGQTSKTGFSDSQSLRNGLLSLRNVT